MKSLIVLATLGLTGFLGTTAASAGDESCAPRHERRVHFRRQHRPEPRFERVWIAPRYEERIVGTDHCGKPICRTVCVSEGYWTTRPVHCD